MIGANAAPATPSVCIDGKVINGDSLEVLKRLPNDSVDAVITDPPYGYNFMGKAWDKALAPVAIWQQCLRVLKPGHWALVMSAPRQDVLSRMIVMLGDVGFDMDFTSLYWAYPSGFPKGGNCYKMVDKKSGIRPIGKIDKETNRMQIQSIKPTTDLAKKLAGSYTGYQPKPAVEVVLMCMKPQNQKGGRLEQAIYNGGGTTQLDSVRIPYRDSQTGEYIPLHKARYASNLIVSGDATGGGKKTKSGIKTPYKHTANNHYGQNCYGGFKTKAGLEQHSHVDSGSYSRFWDLDAWFDSQFFIGSKAIPSERNRGVGKISKEDRNVHPTVKPLSLMCYLISLVTRRDEIVVDPFLGSGTTGMAAKVTGRRWVGIEREPHYAALAQKRINATGTDLGIDSTVTNLRIAAAQARVLAAMVRAAKKKKKNKKRINVPVSRKQNLKNKRSGLDLFFD